MAAEYPGPGTINPPKVAMVGPPYYSSNPVVQTQPGLTPMAATIQVQPVNALAYLEAVDQLVVRQEIHLAEVLLNFKSNVRFSINNSQGQPVFMAEEENDCCTRNCLGAGRPFTIYIKDNMGQILLILRRPFRCCGCCLPCCCLQEMTVESADGRTIGVIRENWNIFTPKYSIEDDTGRTVFRIIGDCCPNAICYCGKDVHFNVFDAASQQQVALVGKQWSGLLQEGYTNATNYGVNFPMELPIYQKTLLLSITFLINFMYFERNLHHTSSSSSGAQ